MVVDTVIGLIGLVDEVYNMYGEVQTADSIVKNLQQCVKLVATELKRIQATKLSISKELMGKIKNTMVKLKEFFHNYEGQCSCFAICSRNDNRDEAEMLDKELSSLIQLLQLNILTPMVGNIAKIFTLLTEDTKQANERKKKTEEKKNLAERLASDEKKEIQKLLEGGFYDKEMGEKLLEDITQIACEVYQAKEERAIIKTSLRYADEEFARIISRGTFDKKWCDAQKEKMKAGVKIEKLEKWIRPYATQWLQLQEVKENLRALDDFKYPTEKFKKAFGNYVSQLKMAYGLVESGEIVSLESEIKDLKAVNLNLEESKRKLEEELEKGEQNRAKLVKELEESKKKLEEEVRKGKQNGARLLKLTKQLEESKRKLKEEAERRKEEETERRKIEETERRRLQKEAERKREEEEAERKKKEAEREQKLSEMKMWKKIPDMNTDRYGLGVAVGDGKMFAVGGNDGRITQKSGEYLDLKKMDAGWKKLPDMNTKRYGLGVAVGDGKLFAVGGYDSNVGGYYGSPLASGEYLDLKNVDAGWKKLPDMNTERKALGVAFGDGKLFAVGGIGEKSGEYLDLKKMDAGWTRIPDMNTKRYNLGVAVGDGKLFAVGGYDSNTQKSGEYLDLKKMDAGWKKLPDMNTERKALGVAFGDGKLFAVGGVCDKSGEHLRIAT